jgi:hypothetical protein
VVDDLLALVFGLVLAALGVFFWRDDFALARAFQSASSGWPIFGALYAELDEVVFRRMMGGAALILGLLMIAAGVTGLT